MTQDLMTKECRPNILIVMYDQLTPSMLSCYGGPAIAPTIDRLSNEGVTFDAAYTNSPLCTPARYCMMTGRLPSSTKGYDNAAYLASTIPTFAHVARRAGYRTALAGKMHFVGPDQLHGFESRRTTDIYPADSGWTPDWRAPHERIDCGTTTWKASPVPVSPRSQINCCSMTRPVITPCERSMMPSEPTTNGRSC